MGNEGFIDHDTPQAAPQSKARVLVIDDEKGIRRMLSFGLSREGYEVVTAESGDGALILVKDQSFDVVITDLRMPGMDGVTLLNALKQQRPDMEVIIITAHASLDTAISCLKGGAYDYLLKPFEHDELVMIVQRAVEKRHLKGMVSLYDASRALLTTLDQGTIINRALDLAQRVIPSRLTAIVLSRLNHDQSEVICHPQTNREHNSVLRRLAISAMESGQSIRFTDPEQSQPSIGDIKDSITSLVAYPLISGNHILGAFLLVRGIDLPAFSDSEMRWGHIFTGQIALSLDNARLHAELQQKIEDLIATRNRLMQTEKMALAGRLAEAVAHEVNNPLSVIKANIGALESNLYDIHRLWSSIPDPGAGLSTQSHLTGRDHNARSYDQVRHVLIEDCASIITECNESIGRIADLVSNFKKLADPYRINDVEEVHLPDALANVLSRLNSEGKLAHRIIREVHSAQSASIVPHDLETALFGIFSWLHTARSVRPKSRAKPLLVLIDSRQDNPCLSITDPTLYLTSEEVNRLFDPNIEASATEHGSMRLNLELTLALNIISRNQGEIRVQSDSENGTRFRIILTSFEQKTRPERQQLK